MQESRYQLNVPAFQYDPLARKRLCQPFAVEVALCIAHRSVPPHTRRIASLRRSLQALTAGLVTSHTLSRIAKHKTQAPQLPLPDHQHCTSIRHSLDSNPIGCPSSNEATHKGNARCQPGRATFSPIDLAGPCTMQPSILQHLKAAEFSNFRRPNGVL